MSDTKTKLIAELDLSKAQKQLSEFLKETHKTELTLDTSSLKKARDELGSLSKVTIKPKIDLSGIKNAAFTAAGELRQIQDLASQIGNVKIGIGGIDTGKLAGVQRQIRQLQTDYQNLGNTLSKGIPTVSTPTGASYIPAAYSLSARTNTNSINQINNSDKGLLDGIGTIATTVTRLQTIGELGTKILPKKNLD